jgi:hypothetical protein
MNCPKCGTELGEPTKNARITCSRCAIVNELIVELIRKQIREGFSSLYDSSRTSSYPPASTLEGLGTATRAPSTDSP